MGCCTQPKYLFDYLKNNNKISWNSMGNEFEITHYHTMGPFSTTHALINKKSIKVITAHTLPSINDEDTVFKYTAPLSKKIYDIFDYIIVISESCKNEIERLGVNGKIEYIPNGINIEKFKHSEKKRKSFRKRYNIADDENVILSAGQLIPRKGLHDFLRLAKLHKEYRFLWVGEFPLKYLSKNYFHIKKLIEKRPKNVIFTSFINDITEAYSGADVFLMPSFKENFPMVMLEAMSAGMPIVARNLPQYNDVFLDIPTYFDNIDSVKNSLPDIIKNKNEMSIKSLKYVKKYDLKVVGKKHEIFYKKVYRDI